MRFVHVHCRWNANALGVLTRYAPIALAGLIVLVGGPSYAETRVAVIASQVAGAEKIVPLLELRLAQNKEIVLLEREKIQEIFREQG